MRCKVIQSEDPSLSRMMSRVSNYGHETIDYIKRNHENFIDKAKHYGSEFVNTARRTFNYFNNKDTIRETIETMHNANVLMGDNVIYELTNENYQRPGLNMKRYVMASPKLNRLYNLNRINGYNDEWYDNEPNTPAKERGDYRRVMDGVVYENEDGESVYSTFSSDETDEPMSGVERICVLQTWDLMHQILADGEDPTDI